jgi:hypothetical protein
MLQYRLDSSQVGQLMQALNSGLYVREYNKLEVLNVMYLKPYPVLQVNFKFFKKSIQKI